MKYPFEKPRPNIFSFVLSACVLFSFSGCISNASVNAFPSAITNAAPNLIASTGAIPADNAVTVMNRPQVPVLCYHQIRSWTASDSKRAEDYIVPVDKFREQIKSLADNGYHTISPDQLYNYLVRGAPLPVRPIMITFDDTRAEQYTIADRELSKYGFKGVFFIMTVSLGRPGYMTKEEVKQLSDEGNTIGSHTWDHSNVKKYMGDDWIKQVDRPSRQLEAITGKPVNYFAYPFGLWNKQAIAQLKSRGFKAAFQLSERRDESDPLFTIRRIIVPGTWTTATLEKWMNESFEAR